MFITNALPVFLFINTKHSSLLTPAREMQQAGQALGWGIRPDTPFAHFLNPRASAAVLSGAELELSGSQLSTWDHRRSALQRYAAFCIGNDIDPRPGATAIAAFMADLLGQHLVKSSITTIKGNLMAAFAVFDVTLPSTLELERISHAVRGVAVQDNHTPNRKAELGLESLVTMITTACGPTPFSPSVPFFKLQMATMMLLSHDCLMRAGEVYPRLYKDILWQGSSPFQVSITKHKTKRIIGAALVVIPAPQPDVAVSAAKALMAYMPRLTSFLERFKIPLDKALLFPQPDSPVSEHKPRYFSSILKSWLTDAQLPASNVTPHSLRAGGATDMARNGATIPEIARHGRFKSSALLLYLRQSDQEFRDRLSFSGAIGSRGVTVPAHTRATDTPRARGDLVSSSSSSSPIGGPAVPTQAAGSQSRARNRFSQALSAASQPRLATIMSHGDIGEMEPQSGSAPDVSSEFGRDSQDKLSQPSRSKKKKREATQAAVSPPRSHRRWQTEKAVAEKEGPAHSFNGATSSSTTLGVSLRRSGRSKSKDSARSSTPDQQATSSVPGESSDDSSTAIQGSSTVQETTQQLRGRKKARR